MGRAGRSTGKNQVQGFDLSAGGMTFHFPETLRSQGWAWSTVETQAHGGEWRPAHKFWAIQFTRVCPGGLVAAGLGLGGFRLIMACVSYPIRSAHNYGLFQIPGVLLQEKAALPSRNHRGNPWSGPAAPQAEGPWLACLRIPSAQHSGWW